MNEMRDALAEYQNIIGDSLENMQEYIHSSSYPEYHSL